MKTVKTFVLQRWETGSGEWVDAGVAARSMAWAKISLADHVKCWPENEYRIVERTVITIDKPVKL